jgi:NAD(P)-dependent dehydrogenase (short-subunit alcohol dehydrogenase family)
VRTYVVTGSASGIGAAVKASLEGRGDRVVGVDQRDAEITVDLSVPAQRDTLVGLLHDLGVHVVDGVLPAAGLSARQAGADKVLAVNYFGAVGTVTRLRPLLSASAAPRVCMISSIGLLSSTDDDVVASCLAGDESATLSLVAADPEWAYERSKRAVSTWVRRTAVDPEWLEAGIRLNAIAPGMIATAMAAHITSSPETLVRLFESYPHPLGTGTAADVAGLATFMLSEENAYMVGQTIFLDGGHEAVCGPAALATRPSMPSQTSSAIARQPGS